MKRLSIAWSQYFSRDVLTVTPSYYHTHLLVLFHHSSPSIFMSLSSTLISNIVPPSGSPSPHLSAPLLILASKFYLIFHLFKSPSPPSSHRLHSKLILLFKHHHNRLHFPLPVLQPTPPPPYPTRSSCPSSNFLDHFESRTASSSILPSSMVIPTYCRKRNSLSLLKSIILTVLIFVLFALAT